ncbi:MAG: PilZ domain-containing protein [Syntrophomonas sp.]|nr:PilZ domain-containing protein [Syntrophomonas sp.]
MGAMTFKEFSQGLSNNLGNKEFFNMSGFAFAIIMIIIIAAVLTFRWHEARTQEAQRRSYKLYKERQRKMASSLSGQQHNRRWFRLKTNAELQWILQAHAETAKKKDFKTDHLVDISGDGLCFTTADNLNIDDEILLFLDIGGGNTVTLPGRAVRIVEDTNPDIKIFNVSVKFGNLRHGERDRVMAWILKRQRAAIREDDPDYAEQKTPNPFDIQGGFNGEL